MIVCRFFICCLLCLLPPLLKADDNLTNISSTSNQTDSILIIIFGIVNLMLLVSLLVQRHRSQLKIKSLLLKQELSSTTTQLHYDSIFETIVDGIIIIDRFGSIQSLNPAAMNMFGYSKDELVGQNVNRLMYDEHSIQHDTYINNYLDTGESRIIGKDRDLRAKHKTGHTIPIELNIGSIQQDGQTLFTGVIRDISERILSVEQSNLFIEMLETSPDIIITFDLEGTIEFMNKSGRTIFGYGLQQDLSHVVINDLFPEIDFVANHAIPIAYMQGYWADETIIIDHKKNKIEVSQVLVKHETSVGGKKLYSTILRDISSSIKAQKDLSKAKETAEAATLVKSKFLATMSHEIRTPMNGVLGMTQVLTNTNLDEKQSEYVRTIYNSGQALLAIINDILDFSKIEAEKLELENIPFNLKNIIYEIRQLFDFQAHDKGIEISSNYPDEADYLFVGDPGRLRQLILNLVSNSLKFTEEGVITINVNIKNTDDNKADITIAVSDTGIGIPKEVQAILFNSFTQADASATRKFGGTGLGLAICKHLIELMGGGIIIDSIDGQGATFTLSLTLDIAEQQQNELATSNINNKHILIAFSSKESANLIDKQLKICNLRTSQVHSLSGLRKNLEKSNPIKYDLIIIDRYLSSRHTCDVIKILHKSNNVRTPNIVVWTQIPARNDGIRFRQSDVVGYIAGHVIPNELKNILACSIAVKDRDSNNLVTKHNSLIPDRNKQEIIQEFSGIEILLVEDNEINRMVAQSMLEYFGLIIKHAPDGKEAVALISQQTFPLIFMDCQMPIMDGYDATRTIRELERDTEKHTTIIAMTANAMKEDREKCLASGMDDFISKPFTQQELHNMLNKWLLTVSNEKVKTA